MRRAVVALVFAAAAAFSSWNPLAAPFGLVVGLAAAVLAWRALRAPPPAEGPGAGTRGRPVAAAALGLAALAVLASAAVLAMTAGVGRGPAGADLVPALTDDEVRRGLDEAAAATKDARERAREELDRAVKQAGDAPREGGGASGGGERSPRPRPKFDSAPPFD